MYRAKRKQIAAGLAIASLVVLLAGCGQNNNGQTGLPGSYIPGGIAAPGCVPVTSPIGFSAANAYVDRVDIAFGSFPAGALAGRTIGQVTVGTGAGGGPLTRTTAEGTISLNVQATGGYYPGQQGYIPQQYTQQYAQNVSGVIQLSQAKISSIMYSAGYNVGYNPYNPGGYYPQQTAMPCVQTVAVWVVWNPDRMQILSTEAYLIINGQPVQVAL